MAEKPCSCDYINPKVFSKRLAQAMKSCGYDADSLSVELDIHPDTVRAYLRGRYLPRLDLLNGIADTLDVSLDYLCGRSESK